MRLWPLSELAQKGKTVIHICVKCEIKTPISPMLELNNNMISSENISPIYIRENYCDECNIEFWEKISDKNKESINNCNGNHDKQQAIDAWNKRA